MSRTPLTHVRSQGVSANGLKPMHRSAMAEAQGALLAGIVVAADPGQVEIERTTLPNCSAASRRVSAASTWSSG